jgi:cytochrome c biogenesis protein CcmG/thiol:disulfide interchange protein DsbE
MTKESRAAPAPLRRFGPLLPLVIFAVLAGLFWYALGSGDPSRLPSPLIGKKVPEFTLPPLDGLAATDGTQVPGFAASDLAQGEPTLVNVFASWCLECQTEHPLLVALGQSPGIRLYGIDYKDDHEAGLRFLGRYGNPYARVGTDRSGRVAIDFGVYGVPETYVVMGDGTIAYRHVGPLTEQVVRDKILPLLEKRNGKPEG